MGTRKAARAQEPRHNSPNLWPEPKRGSFRSLVNLTLSPKKKQKNRSLWLTFSLTSFIYLFIIFFLNQNENKLDDKMQQVT